MIVMFDKKRGCYWLIYTRGESVVQHVINYRLFEALLKYGHIYFSFQDEEKIIYNHYKF